MNVMENFYLFITVFCGIFTLINCTSIVKPRGIAFESKTTIYYKHIIIIRDALIIQSLNYLMCTLFNKITIYFFQELRFMYPTKIFHVLMEVT